MQEPGVPGGAAPPRNPPFCYGPGPGDMPDSRTPGRSLRATLAECTAWWEQIALKDYHPARGPDGLPQSAVIKETSLATMLTAGLGALGARMRAPLPPSALRLLSTVLISTTPTLVGCLSAISLLSRPVPPSGLSSHHPPCRWVGRSPPGHTVGLGRCEVV